MADEEVLKRIEARLTRLEAAIAQGAQGGGGPTNVAAPGGAIVDPAPWWGGGWVPWRPIPITTPIVNPVSDPAPWGGGRPPVFTNPIGTIADPAPWGGGVFGRSPGFPSPIGVIADPAPWASVFSRPSGFPTHIGPIADPAPADLGRFTSTQLESSLHTIAAERARLDAVERMIKERIANLKKEGSQG
jgi:hypothetical protein